MNRQTQINKSGYVRSWSKQFCLTMALLSGCGQSLSNRGEFANFFQKAEAKAAKSLHEEKERFVCQIKDFQRVDDLHGIQFSTVTTSKNKSFDSQYTVTTGWILSSTGVWHLDTLEAGWENEFSEPNAKLILVDHIVMTTWLKELDYNFRQRDCYRKYLSACKQE